MYIVVVNNEIHGYVDRITESGKLGHFFVLWANVCPVWRRCERGEKASSL